MCQPPLIGLITKLFRHVEADVAIVGRFGMNTRLLHGHWCPNIN
jgi:hypothetical protein